MLAEEFIGIGGATWRRRDDGDATDLGCAGGSGLGTLEVVIVGAEEEGAGGRLEEPLFGVWA